MQNSKESYTVTQVAQYICFILLCAIILLLLSSSVEEYGLKEDFLPIIHLGWAGIVMITIFGFFLLVLGQSKAEKDRKRGCF